MSFTPLEKFGLFSAVIFGYVALRKILGYVYTNFIGAKRIDFKAMGQWALITGATDGIGKAYARALAKRGCDIILVSRTQQKLEDVAAEIEQEFNVKTKIIAVDFTGSENIYEHIEKQILGLEIGVLINNVGVAFMYPDHFLDVPNRDEIFDQIIKANIIAVTKMCAMIMPQMVERRKGVVINLSSLSAWMPAPTFSVYAASKLYVDKLTVDLAASYESKGLIIQSIVPGPVATKMTKIHRATWMAPTPDDYVAAALNSCGKSIFTPAYGPHKILMGFISTLEWISPSFTVWMFIKTTDNIKKRALKKLAARRA